MKNNAYQHGKGDEYIPPVPPFYVRVTILYRGSMFCGVFILVNSSILSLFNVNPNWTMIGGFFHSSQRVINPTFSDAIHDRR